MSEILAWLPTPMDTGRLRQLLDGLDGCVVDIDDTGTLIVRAK